MPQIFEISKYIVKKKRHYNNAIQHLLVHTR